MGGVEAGKSVYGVDVRPKESLSSACMKGVYYMLY